MRRLKWILVVALSCLAACNYTVGQCWIDENGNGEPDPGEPGAGGGPIVPPGGTGDNGDAPEKEPQDAQDPPVCNSIGSYSPSLFHFVTTLADDGQGLAGGWQEATATVDFVDGRQDPPASWSCTVKVGMAVRSSILGKISPSEAAAMTVTVLTHASSVTMHSRKSWLKALFCQTLEANMLEMFGEAYNGAGARVNAK